MSQEVYQGPGDKLRSIQDFAVALGSALIETPLQKHEIPQMGQLLRDLDAENPFMGQDVSISGIVVQPSIDEETGKRHLTMPPNETPTSDFPLALLDDLPHGMYDGLAIRPVHDPDKGDTTHVVLHTLFTGGERYFDDIGDLHTVAHFTYVIAYDAEIIPDLPINLHSFADLRGDEMLRELDQVIFEEGLGLAERLRRIGEISAAAFNKDEADARRNRQRVSYLNALGLLDGVTLVSKDVAFVDERLLFGGPTLDCSDLTQTLGLPGPLFDIGSSYSRWPSGIIVPGGPPELYARGKPDQGRVPMMPLKNLLEVISS